MRTASPRIDDPCHFSAISRQQDARQTECDQGTVAVIAPHTICHFRRLPLAQVRPNAACALLSIRQRVTVRAWFRVPRSMTNLPESRFDTRELPSRMALDAWQSQISVLFDARVQKSQQDGFFAAVNAWL